MATKRCKIHYRKLRREGDSFPSQSLAGAIEASLGTEIDGKLLRTSVKNRIADTPGNPGFRRFTNNIFSDQTADIVFGDICLFSPGQMQALLEIADEDGNPSLDDVMRAWDIAESKAPEGKEYLHAIAYWMAIGDHFYQIQHTSLQAKALEEYLTWMLRDQANVLNSEQYVALDSVFDRAQLGEDVGDITSIEVGGFVPDTVAKPAAVVEEVSVEVSKHEDIGSKRAPMDKSRDVLEVLFGEIETDKIIQSIPDEAALEVNVNIGYRSRKRKINRQFMSDIESGLRNLPDGEVRVRGTDGNIRGDDARLATDMTVRKISENSSLLDLESAFEQMKEVHRRFLHDGKITEN